MCTHEIVSTSSQTEEKFLVRLVRDRDNLACGLYELECDGGVGGKTILVRVPGVPYE